MRALVRPIRLFGAAALAGLLAVAGCFSVPPLEGSYRCGAQKECPLAGSVCFDGVCCRPDGEPRCEHYVLEGGLCEDGGTASTFYEDLDRDGVGSLVEQRVYCRQPVFDAFAPDAGDCDDRPDVGRQSRPGLPEVCDGRDNNCDGTPDEGLPQKTFYLDQDADGFGDPAQPTSACAAPENFVENNLDCEPTATSAHPGGSEACNGFDDDCDGTKDDNLSGFGEACTATATYGVCRPGLTACINGAAGCQSTTTPSLDICDGLDNDCDNQTDEKPDCSGPGNLLAAPQSLGAKNLGSARNGDSSVCLKGEPGTVETFTGGVWTGVSSNSHVAWSEAPANKYWDLRNSAELSLAFSYAMTNANATRAWSEHRQPVVHICGPGGFIRMVHTASFILGVASSGTETLRVPMGKNLYGWVVGGGSAADVNAVLGQVNRIELLIQPNSSATTPGFTLTFSNWGFY